MKILTIFGTRPEAIKLAPLVKLLEQTTCFDSYVCVTAQHRQMLDQVLNVFDIIPDYDLDIMQDNQDLSSLTGSLVIKIGEILETLKPERIIVHGDTTTTLCASLAAFYKKIPVAHVEAGLRTGDIYSPWPEEINRKLTASLTDMHFAPTENAKNNLIHEGFDKRNIYITGNTVIDSILMSRDKILSSSHLQNSIKETIPKLHASKKTILVTCHRRESFGEDFREICEAIKEISSRDDIQIVFPVHLNPNVQKPVKEILSNCANIHLIEPCQYLSFIYLMQISHIILSDSGGLQEEAPALNRPILVLRKKTERPEAIEAGTAKLVGTDRSSIINKVFELLESDDEYEKMASAENPFGNGTASQQIIMRLKEYHGLQ